MGASVIPFRGARRESPPVEQMVERVQALSTADSLNVRMNEPHFKERMMERGIDMRLVLEVLRRGRAVGHPKLDEFGDWRITMRRKVAGRRVHVVVAICADHVERITTWA